MAYTSLKAKLFAAAQLNARLVYLLGGGSPLVLKWFDQQLWPAAGFPVPAVVVQIVSNPSTTTVSGRLPTSFTRVQFTVYGTGTDSQNADEIVEALTEMLDNFSGDGVLNRPANACPNIIVGDRDGGIARTQPLTFMRIVDAQIFWNPYV